jgi:hypothetical protein
MEFKKFSAGLKSYGKWEAWGKGDHQKETNVNFNDPQAFDDLKNPLSENHSAILKLREAIGVC